MKELILLSERWDHEVINTDRLREEMKELINDDSILEELALHLSNLRTS
jgi:hypothetical protein